MLKKVLIVCIGNICRSPTAEILLRDRLKDSDVEVRSAGIAALVGGSIEPTARKLLAECEPLEIDHKGKQLTPECVKWADLILVMERKHVSAVLAIAPEGVDPMPGLQVRDPSFGMPATWIERGNREVAISRGHTVVEPAVVITTHLDQLIAQHAHELLGRQETHELIEHFKTRFPKLVEETIPKLVQPAQLQAQLAV